MFAAAGDEVSGVVVLVAHRADFGQGRLRPPAVGINQIEKMPLSSLDSVQLTDH